MTVGELIDLLLVAPKDATVFNSEGEYVSGITWVSSPSEVTIQ